MEITIRNTAMADFYAVEELTRDAFWSSFRGEGQTMCDEHLLVHRLRHCPSYISELDFVAVSDRTIVGHIIYTKTKIIDNKNKTHPMLKFGPLSVRPDCQNKGIGAALMRHSFTAAKALGYRAVIIYGHPGYYPRVGFRRASEFGIFHNDGDSFDALMAYELYEGALNGISGKYYYDSIYDSLTQEAAAEFDKRFPVKPPYDGNIPIAALLGRLNPAARAAIESLNYEWLSSIQNNSEREIAALQGFDAESSLIVYNTMRENKIPWGEKR
jgi:predicted N-acetyltransferase YhbS